MVIFQAKKNIDFSILLTRRANVPLMEHQHSTEHLGEKNCFKIICLSL